MLWDLSDAGFSETRVVPWPRGIRHQGGERGGARICRKGNRSTTVSFFPSAGAMPRDHRARQAHAAGVGEATQRRMGRPRRRCGRWLPSVGPRSTRRPTPRRSSGKRSRRQARQRRREQRRRLDRDQHGKPGKHVVIPGDGDPCPRCDRPMGAHQATRGSESAIVSVSQIATPFPERIADEFKKRHLSRHNRWLVRGRPCHDRRAGSRRSHHSPLWKNALASP